MRFEDIDLRGFEEREKLREVKRYSMYDVMWYRPDVFFHSKKVYFLVKKAIDEVGEFLPDNFDVKKTLLMALIHDDVECVIGDFQSGNKLIMTKKQLEEKDERERIGIEEFVSRMPKVIEGYDYRELLFDVFEMNTVESQFVKYFDRVDGFCEAIHEVVAGNRIFCVDVETEFGVAPCPLKHYYNHFNQTSKEYSLLSFVLSKFPFVDKVSDEDLSGILREKSEKHTEENLDRKISFEPYNWWKEVLIESLSDEDLKNLYEQKEG